MTHFQKDILGQLIFKKSQFQKWILKLKKNSIFIDWNFEKFAIFIVEIWNFLDKKITIFNPFTLKNDFEKWQIWIFIDWNLEKFAISKVEIWLF